MGDNTTLASAKKAKQDEFYTQYSDIQTEMNAYLEYDPNVFKGKTVLLPCDDPEWSNFTRYFAENFVALGLKKLISTSYAPEAKTAKYGSLFEYAALQNGEAPKNERGKIFVLDHDVTGDGKVNFEDIEWTYLKGDGDFRSGEVCSLRNEADIIVTNPPFSLFRDFLEWVIGGDGCAQRREGAEADRITPVAVKERAKQISSKQFLFIGNMNAITYKEVFPLIKCNRMWLGNGFTNGNAFFRISDGMRTEYANGVYDSTTNLVKFRNVAWFTNLEHGRRHQPLRLMSMADNIKFSRHREVKDVGYKKYDNYDAIEVPFTDAIPCDYDGVMGVPISFIAKYCPEQFEIIGMAASAGYNKSIVGLEFAGIKDARPLVSGRNTYARIFIRRRQRNVC